MASYTIEDIELIRKKSGISYQEAVALLDYHNGNVARALIDLERNGRIQSDEPQQRPQQQSDPRAARRSAVGFLQRLYRTRVHVAKDRTPVANLSILFVGACFLVSPWTVIGSAILSAVLGYKISYVRDDPDFGNENLEKTVRSACDNAKSTVDDLMGTIKDAAREVEKKAQAAAAEPGSDAAPAADSRSYYGANPAATTYHSSYTGSSDIPTIQVPVQVQSQDGNVSVEDEGDGHSSATIG